MRSAGLVAGIPRRFQTITFHPTLSCCFRAGIRKRDVSTIVTQLIGGGAGGALLTAIAGAIKNKAAA